MSAQRRHLEYDFGRSRVSLFLLAPPPRPSDLLKALNAAGREGVTFQRYKGLGEMNKDQLWETALDHEARSLLQVKIREVDEADDMFVKLMGDVVEPRREFIQDNALTVANLGV